MEDNQKKDKSGRFPKLSVYKRKSAKNFDHVLFLVSFSNLIARPLLPDFFRCGVRKGQQRTNHGKQGLGGTPAPCPQETTNNGPRNVGMVLRECFKAILGKHRARTPKKLLKKKTVEICLKMKVLSNISKKNLQ